jgi:ribose 1,5-bisphosphokinase PhnN
MTDWINVNGTRSVTPDFHQLYLIDSTPVIILLDKNKKILAKRLAAKNVLDFLNLLNRQQKK